MSDVGTGVEKAKLLWTIDLPKSRQTRWHQTLAELTMQVGQAIGFAIAWGIEKKIEVRLEVEIDGGDHVRVWCRAADEEFVALDAKVESAPH